jgi:uncharacterized protein
MEWSNIWPALLGGSLVGLAAVGLLGLTGKTAGVSGILDGILRREKGELGWKAAFALGLIAGGALLWLFWPAAFPDAAPRALPLVIAAGLLIGFGARFGGGCTSGHGVCGVGRASARSLAGTATFMLTGMLTVLILRVIGA